MKRLLAIVVILISVCLTLVLADLALQHTRFRSLIPQYSFVSGYSTVLPDGEYDIRPNYPTSTVPFFDHPFSTWSNALGCFDDSFDPKSKVPIVYITGDSFTWGYVPHEDNWGTVLQQSLGIRTLTCGVSGYGTASELKKTTRDLSSLAPPKIIFVGYYRNDPINDGDPSNERAPESCQLSPTSFICYLHRNWLWDHSVLY